MSEPVESVLSPRVAEALARDLGKGLVRLDPSDIARLGLRVGDVVELAGRRKTFGKLMPTYSAYRGRGRLQIDGVTRENAGTTLEQAVQVRPARAADAVSVTLAPLTRPPTDSELKTIAKRLAGIPVVVGDRLRVDFLGQRAADFRVLKTEPAGPVVFRESTRFAFGRPMAEGELPEERTSFKPFAYEDVGGLARELGRVREIVELPLRYPEVFGRLGVAAPKGVLLHGPPGTGKTLIARAVAHETEAAFFTVNGPEIIHKYYGESEARLREVFEQAAKQAPSVIFIDELDAIAPKRDRVAGDVEKRVVGQLLTLMDGLAQRSQVVVLAATNLPDALDPALRRPGRFDREIAIPIPDRDARREILEVHRRGMPLAPEVDLDHLAAITHGFVGADLAALCREAAMSCLHRVLPTFDGDGDSVPDSILNALEVTPEDFAGALREVEPSAVREVFVERPTARWADIGGNDEVRRKLTEAVAWPLGHAALLAKAGVRSPRGVLLSGPPGCGKTLLVRALANESGLHFLAVKGPELLSKYVGESERAVREVFQKARQAAPCLVFFDEIDALLPARGSGSGDRIGDRVMGQFLSEMDGVEEMNGVLILGATNRPDRLDPALLRPGRFDLHLAIRLPDRDGRVAIARVALRDKPHDEWVSAEGLADLTEGFSGAEIQAVCNHAALSAVRVALESEPAGEPLICLAQIHEALDEMKAMREISGGANRQGMLGVDGSEVAR